jgi:hypothetical protein
MTNDGTKPPLPNGRARNPRYKGKPPEIPKEQKRTLPQIIRELPGTDEWEKLDREISTSSDRSGAILLAAQIERFLEFAIISNLQPVDDATHVALIGREGPLSTFFSKAYLGYAMGLYDGKILQDLNIIRRVRNVFAHAVRSVDFRTTEIADECAALQTADAELSGRGKYELSGLLGIPVSRERYMSAGNYIAIALLKLLKERAERRLLAKTLMAGP